MKSVADAVKYGSADIVVLLIEFAYIFAGTEHNFWGIEAPTFVQTTIFPFNHNYY